MYVSSEEDSERLGGGDGDVERGGGRIGDEITCMFFTEGLYEEIIITLLYIILVVV